MVAEYVGEVPDAEEFAQMRELWRRELSESEALHEEAVKLFCSADRFHYGYQWEWLGVPIIRLPDDIVLFQEIVWSYGPEAIIETGVARGGSVILSASLMDMAGIKPAVLGLDVSVLQHTRDSIMRSRYANAIRIVECDSTSQAASDAVQAFLSAGALSRAVLVLDSSHTHDHVLNELRVLGPLLPEDSLVLVADTIIEEMQPGYYARRPWDVGNNPATAITQFLQENTGFSLDPRWNRRALVSEFRDGILVKTSRRSSISAGLR